MRGNGLHRFREGSSIVNYQTSLKKYLGALPNRDFINLVSALKTEDRGRTLHNIFKIYSLFKSYVTKSDVVRKRKI